MNEKYRSIVDLIYEFFLQYPEEFRLEKWIRVSKDLSENYLDYIKSPKIKPSEFERMLLEHYNPIPELILLHRYLNWEFKYPGGEEFDESKVILLYKIGQNEFESTEKDDLSPKDMHKELFFDLLSYMGFLNWYFTDFYMVYKTHRINNTNLYKLLSDYNQTSDFKIWYYTCDIMRDYAMDFVQQTPDIYLLELLHYVEVIELMKENVKMLKLKRNYEQLKSLPKSVGRGRPLDKFTPEILKEFLKSIEDYNQGKIPGIAFTNHMRNVAGKHGISLSNIYHHINKTIRKKLGKEHINELSPQDYPTLLKLINFPT